ncbi:MAG: Mur ligase family protein, partial [Alphaproteobacteria bacterium]|nr:Mur ligase family protein [Alphaproteobacteria bacterium]
YLQIGRWVRGQSKAKVVAITGSAGKTSTKEMMKLVLSRFAKVYATDANYNNAIGVAQTLCAIPDDAEIAVIEVAMSAKGTIANNIQFVRPDIAVVTNVYAMHLEFFDSVEGIAHAKAEIFGGLSSDGIAVINRDSNYFDILQSTAAKSTSNIVTYGTGDDTKFELSVPGDHHVSNAWCVMSVVKILGLDMEKAAAAIKEFGAVDGRGKTHELKLADGGAFRLIDDSYSAQPESLRLAIVNLNNMKAARKIAIIGKMAEIGEKSQEMHVEIGKALAETDIDIVVGICPEAKDILAQINDDKMEKHYFENSDGLDDWLLDNMLRDGDVVLVKGSHYGSKLFMTAKSLVEKCSDKGD